MTTHKDRPHDTKRRFLFERAVQQAEGTQVFFVDAESQEDAVTLLNEGEGDIYSSEVGVTQLGGATFICETSLDDFGDAASPVTPAAQTVAVPDELRAAIIRLLDASTYIGEQQYLGEPSPWDEVRAFLSAPATPAKVEDGAAKKRPNLRPSDETVRFIAECFKHDPSPNSLDEFNRGVLYAAAWLVLAYGDDVMAARMVRDAGLNGTDCSEMDDYDKDGLRKIAEQCRLRGLSAAQAKEGKP